MLEILTHVCEDLFRNLPLQIHRGSHLYRRSVSRLLLPPEDSHDALNASQGRSLLLTNAPLTSLESSIRSQGKYHQGGRREQECENHDRALARCRGELSNIPVRGSSSKEGRHQESDASAYTGSASKRKNGNTKRKDETRGRVVAKSRIPSPVSTNTIKHQQEDQRGRDDAAASHLLL